MRRTENDGRRDQAAGAISGHALDQVFIEKIGDRLAAYVIALEPLLRSEVPSDVAWSESRRLR